MIRFALRCDDGHGFESWFANNEAFDRQAASGLVNCPVCGSAHVVKAVMAPHVVRSSLREAADHAGTQDGSAAPAPGAGVQGGQATIVEGLATAPEAGPPEMDGKALRAFARALRRHVEATTDDVGDRFADEAIRMHHGDIEHRAIRGRAGPEEARMLIEEGVGFMPLPALPDERN